jgi:Tol biopolymer transport system component
MMMKSIGFVFSLFFLVSCVEQDSFDPKRSETSSQIFLNIDEMIDYAPEMIGPGVISTGNFEGHATVSPDGKEIYFAIYTHDHGYSTIAYSIIDDSTWSKPQIVEFSGRYSDGSPALSPDGERLFFSSTRPIGGDHAKSDNDIWYVERTASGWGEPIHLGDAINTEAREFSPSVDLDGKLYFCSDRPNGRGDMDVYESALVNGNYEIPVNLGDSINSIYREGNVGVSPDGTLLFVMVQNRPGDYGYDDIHYSVKKGNEWSNAKNIGELINTYTYDFSPKVSPDGSYLYLTSRVNRDYNRIGQRAYTYDEYQDYLSSPLNGFGNIYRIGIGELGLE